MHHDVCTIYRLCVRLVMTTRSRIHAKNMFAHDECGFGQTYGIFIVVNARTNAVEIRKSIRQTNTVIVFFFFFLPNKQSSIVVLFFFFGSLPCKIVRTYAYLHETIRLKHYSMDRLKIFAGIEKNISGSHVELIY